MQSGNLPQIVLRNMWLLVQIDNSTLFLLLYCFDLARFLSKPLTSFLQFIISQFNCTKLTSEYFVLFENNIPPKADNLLNHRSTFFNALIALQDKFNRLLDVLLSTILILYKCPDKSTQGKSYQKSVLTVQLLAPGNALSTLHLSFSLWNSQVTK